MGVCLEILHEDLFHFCSLFERKRSDRIAQISNLVSAATPISVLVRVLSAVLVALNTQTCGPSDPSALTLSARVITFGSVSPHSGSKRAPAQTGPTSSLSAKQTQREQASGCFIKPRGLRVA